MTLLNDGLRQNNILLNGRINKNHLYKDYLTRENDTFSLLENKMEAELDLMVTLYGVLARGAPERFSDSLGQWLPEDGDEIEDFKIFIGSIDITKEVYISDRDRLYNAYLKSKRREHEEL